MKESIPPVRVPQLQQQQVHDERLFINSMCRTDHHPAAHGVYEETLIMYLLLLPEAMLQCPTRPF